MSTNNPDARPPAMTPAAPAEPQPTPPRPRSHLLRWVLIGGAASGVVVLLLVYGIPWVYAAFTEESTDDAYVNGHVTFVAARVPGQVLKVEVDDNKRVYKGQLLVVLDPEPYQNEVNKKTATRDSARRDLKAAEAGVRAQIGLARANRFKLQNSIDNVKALIEQLRGNAVDLEAAKARRARALSDYQRLKDLKKTPGSYSETDFDQKFQDLRVANANVQQARETAYKTRAGLGLPPQPEVPQSDKKKPAEPDTSRPGAKEPAKSDKDPVEDSVDLESDKYLTEVPPNFDQDYSVVRQVQGELLQSAAPLGVYPSSYNMTPKEMLEELYRRDPKGNIDNITDQIMKDAPAVKQAEAKVVEAERDLTIAELNLRYCEVRAEIDGVITRRNVNPGNNVQAGENLMAIRSLTEIWVDANFKETQLRQLRIGQQVRLEVDAYGRHHIYRGHVTGFTMGTGSTLSLLPPENATGNFVKVVQRLPVRIELDDYDPDHDPLFIGLSVEPHVYLNRPLVDGPDAGKVLQSPFAPPPPKQPDTPSLKRSGGKP